MSEHVERFYAEYSRALREGTAALFAGAGLSVPAGYVDWKKLLKPLADELRLDVEQETDLPALAQFAVNEEGGNRTAVSQRILEDLTRDVSLTESHGLLARLPIRSVWTTNYDDLLEKAFAREGKRVDIKRRATGLSLTMPDADVTLYKMHGDITEPERAVITKDDYESYNDGTRQLFTTTLQAELATKTFLFLGFSFTDTNLGSILGRVRGLLGNNNRRHFWIDKRKSGLERRRQELQVGNLLRYGIRCVLVDDYAEIPRMLGTLQQRARLNNVFISGTIGDPGVMGQERLEQFAMALSGRLVRKGYSVFSGFGRGLGESIYAGAFKVLREPRSGTPRGRMELCPMPRGLPEAERPAAYTAWRTQVIRQTGFSIILCGNRWDDAGKLFVGPGIREEFDIARREGCRPIPVAATGHGAAASGAVELWKELMGKLDTFYPEGGVEPFFQVLGDLGKSNEELLEAIFGIIQRVSQP
ncbi:MAG TPA: SIR2 family protein [Archangium sp.]|nr:SIR2 family protein [Archangium sp.]